MVPRLDDRVRPTPSTTHRENHPRQVQVTRAKHGSVCLTAVAASSPRISTAAPSVFPSPSSAGAAAAAAGGGGGGGGCCSPQTADQH